MKPRPSKLVAVLLAVALLAAQQQGSLAQVAAVAVAPRIKAGAQGFSGLSAQHRPQAAAPGLFAGAALSLGVPGLASSAIRFAVLGDKKQAIL